MDTVDAHVPLDTIYVRIRGDVGCACARHRESGTGRDAAAADARRIDRAGSRLSRGRAFASASIFTSARISGTGDATWARPSERGEQRGSHQWIQRRRYRHTAALVILGPPGSRKTTLLNYIARRAAENADGPIPLQISLREFAMARSATGSNALRDIALTRSAAVSRMQRALADRIDARQALWLLDGLDEARGWAKEA